MIIIKLSHTEAKVFTIYPFLNSIHENGDLCRITVTQPLRVGKTPDNTEISWPSCGPQSRDYLSYFYEAMQFAYYLACELDSGKDVKAGTDIWAGHLGKKTVLSGERQPS